MVRVGPGQAEAVLLIDSPSGWLIAQDASGTWHRTGMVSRQLHDPALRDKLSRGDFTVQPHPWSDVKIGDQVLTIIPAL